MSTKLKNKKSKPVVKKNIKPVKKEKTHEEKNAHEKSKKTYSTLRGMHDILPREERFWKKCFRVSDSLAENFQFNRIETPILEEASLFIRSIGRGTDVVDKEMYVFEDRDGTKVCLRPEGTAGVVRAFIGNGMWNLPQPIKVWYWEQMFRHDRPQAGRFREFRQVGFETFGSHEAVIDAELILVAHNFFKDIGLPTIIHINSIGTPEERQKYKTELVNYYRTKRAYICEDCKQRINRNPLRLLDCKENQCQEVKENAPQIVDWLTSESKNHFIKVLEYLDELSVPYKLDPTLVRGLDYYTHTVFEVFTDFGEDQGSQSALGGGGRYDLLVGEMGGKSTPACGMAIGLERTIAVWREYLEKNKIDFPKDRPDVFLAQLGEEARRVSLKIINQLRLSNIKIGFNFCKGSLKNQMELADAAKVQYVIIIGQKEVQDETVIIRDMESGVQEIVDQRKLENFLKRKLGKID